MKVDRRDSCRLLLMLNALPAALLLASLLFIGMAATVAADLPSCSRAKCSHCRVPFIAEMCPGACSACEQTPAGNHFITTAQNSHTVLQDARAFTQTQQARVPFAQQLPPPSAAVEVIGVVPLEANLQQQQQIIPQQKIGNWQKQQSAQWTNNNNNNNNNGNTNQNNIGNQAAHRNQQYGGQVVEGPAVAGTALPPNQQQQQAVLLPQQQQQQAPTSYGGFYNNQLPRQQTQQGFHHQQTFIQQPPNPPLSSETIPFQTFLQQQPFNTGQQQQQQFGAQMLMFTPPPPPPPPIPPVQTNSPQQQQPQVQYGSALPAAGQFNNNNQQYVPAAGAELLQNSASPLLHNNQNQQQQTAYQQQQQGPNVLHAIPNFGDPLQRPLQLYNLRGAHEGDKQLQSVVEPTNYVLDKGVSGEEIKKARILQGENAPTCSKQPNWEPCVPKEIANQRFRNCCTRLGDGCSSLCSYDQNLNTIQLAILTGRCPVSRVAEMMVCASGNEDATACCQAFGVFEPGYEHCRPYCNPSQGLPNDGMLAEKYRCLQKLQHIQKCFYLTQRP